MEIFIKLTGNTDADYFNISSSSDGINFGPDIVTGISKVTLFAGYDLSGVPNDAIKIKITSNVCDPLILSISNYPTPTPTLTPTATVQLTPTPTPTVGVTPTPTPTVAPYWYILSKCSGSGNFYAGSFTTYPQLPIGRRVEGLPGVYYTILNIVYSQPSVFYTQVTITDTGFNGCPSATPTPTPTPTTTATPTLTPTSTTVMYLFFKFYRCDSTICYMSESTYNYYITTYGSSYFQTGNRYYGTVEGDPTYLYTYTGLVEYLSTPTPSCQLTGVSSTTDVCP